MVDEDARARVEAEPVPATAPPQVGGATRPAAPSVRQVLALQRGAGNHAVAGLLGGAAAPARRLGRAVLARSAAMAPQVTAQVAQGRFIEAEETMPPGAYGPPQSGGAFWLLNGLNEVDLNDVLRAVGHRVRGQLLAHIDETAGRYDTPRLKAALRAESWGEHDAGVSGIGLLDAIRTAQAGTISFADVWAQLAGKRRPELIATLRVLPRESITTLQGHLGEAPAAEQTMLGEIMTDLLGSGTDMSADDVIDLEPLRGQDRTMASIYNLRGRLLQEQAAGLGINTAAAAGIMQVESGGATFSDATNRSITRFENHVFWDRWGHSNQHTFNDHFQFAQTPGQKRFEGHQFRNSPTGAWAGFHGNQTREREVLEFAVSLAGDVAYECASFGAGQIMGFNHATVGFTTAREMVEAYDRSERAQITGIFDYIRSARLAAAVNRGDFRAVARGYNGGGQVDAYAARMESAARSYAMVTTGKLHVIP